MQWNLLCDVGSTTVDLIPLRDGRPATVGKTDTERLLAGELVYTGVERSPLCAVAHNIEINGQSRPLAQELFATTLDAYLLLGELPEDSSRKDTADGRPKTRAAAHARLARAFCADRSELSLAEATAAAEQFQTAQVKLIVAALEQVVVRQGRPPSAVILSGHGEFLAKRVLAALPWQARPVAFSERLSPAANRCAAAHALAVLAREQPTP